MHDTAHRILTAFQDSTSGDAEIKGRKGTFSWGPQQSRGNPGIHTPCSSFRVSPLSKFCFMFIRKERGNAKLVSKDLRVLEISVIIQTRKKGSSNNSNYGNLKWEKNGNKNEPSDSKENKSHTYSVMVYMGKEPLKKRERGYILIHFDVQQKLAEYCKLIILQ